MVSLTLCCFGEPNLGLEASLFKSLRFLLSGYDVPLHIHRAPDAPASPYQIFYNLYKPSTPFKKTAPPPPDFQVVVVKYVSIAMQTITKISHPVLVRGRRPCQRYLSSLTSSESCLSSRHLSRANDSHSLNKNRLLPLQSKRLLQKSPPLQRLARRRLQEGCCRGFGRGHWRKTRRAPLLPGRQTLFLP